MAGVGSIFLSSMLSTGLSQPRSFRKQELLVRGNGSNYGIARSRGILKAYGEPQSLTAS